MITGFNTDVKYDGVTYHVQTEDKGVDTPLILSLVYAGGTILASKRSAYDDMLGKDFDEQVLEQKLKRQHKLMCAAVQSGRIEDLKRMTAQNAAGTKANGKVESIATASKPKAKPKTKTKTKAPFVETKAPPVIEAPLKKEVPEPVELPIPKPTDIPLIPLIPPEVDVPSPDILQAENIPGNSVAPLASAEPNLDPTPGETEVWDVPITEGIEIIEEEDDFFDEGFVLAPDAIQVVGDDFGHVDAGLPEELKIKFLADYVFRAGEKKNVNLLVCRGVGEKEVENASIMIKVLGAAFRPMIFHAKTDKHGVATVFVKLPMFRAGRAAILVRASIDNEETELRKVIMHQ